MGCEHMTDGLIRKLNESCEALRAAGKCRDECIDIGWCADCWSSTEINNEIDGERADAKGSIGSFTAFRSDAVPRREISLGFDLGKLCPLSAENQNSRRFCT